MTDRSRSSPLTGIPATELEARRERLLELVRSRGLTGLRRLRRALHPLPGGALVPLDGTARRLRAERERRGGRLRPGVRGRARPGRDVVRDRRVVPRVPGHRAPDGDPRARARRPRDRGQDRRRPGRLPRDPRLPRAGTERGDGRVDHVARGGDRGDAGAQERGRDRAHPTERALVRACPPASAGRDSTGRHRSGGEPSRRARSDARAAREPPGAATWASSRRRTASRRATGARSACAARGRTRSPTTSSSAPATSSSPRRARRSGATTPSSSVRS